MGAKLELLMIFPGGGDFYNPEFKPVLGSAYILAYLRKNGIAAKQFISHAYLNIELCVTKILKKNPKVVGFTVYNSNVMQSLLIAKALKQANPKIIIIFGGPTSTVQADEILKQYIYVDLCVRGEGEEVLLDLMNLFNIHNYELQKIPLENVKGISYRKQNKIINCPDSDILYSHRYDSNYLDKYPSPHLNKVLPFQESLRLGIITGRGCNQNCVFCNCATLSKRNVYFHSIDRVIEELEYLNQTEEKQLIPIIDDTFTIIPKRAREICERIIDQDLKMSLGCITRADKIDEDLLDLMHSAGFKTIGFSLESSVPKILRNIGKVNPPKKKADLNYEEEKNFITSVERMASHAKKLGMTVYISTMIGLPGESIKDAEQTIKTIRKINPSFYTHNYFHIYKGTPIYKNRDMYGYEIKQIGKINKFFTINSYPFDVYEVKLGPNATDLNNFKVIDYNALQTLSLTSLKGKQQNFFIKAIINSDYLTPPMVAWLQKNLVINGSIYHFYSNQKKYEDLYLRNEQMLLDLLSPTEFYEHYYWEKKNGEKTLKSGRMAKFRENIGICIEFKDMISSLTDYMDQVGDMGNIVAESKNMKEIKAFLDFYDELNTQEEPFEFLFAQKLNPQFIDLCKWTAKKSNCLCMETAILTEDGVHICWNSGSIANLGSDFTQIKHIIESKRRSFENQLNCNSCLKKSDCVKCIYPYPMDHIQFCKESKNRNKKAGNVLYSFNAIKELLFKRIRVYDY